MANKNKKCLQCQEKLIQKSWIHFCGESCANGWLSENVSSFRSTSGDEGSRCKKCMKKIGNQSQREGIDIEDFDELIKHFDLCEGSKGNACKNCGNSSPNGTWSTGCPSQCNWRTKTGCQKCSESIHEELRKHKETCEIYYHYNKGNQSDKNRAKEVAEGWWSCKVCQKDLQGGSYDYPDCLEEEIKIKWCKEHKPSQEQMNQWLLKYAPEIGLLDCPNCGEKYEWLRNSSGGNTPSRKLPCRCEKTEFVKGQCSKCSQTDVWINKNTHDRNNPGKNACFPCDIVQKKLEMEVWIKESSLEQCRLDWHNDKARRELIIRQNKHVESELRQLFSEIDAVLGLSSSTPPSKLNQNLIILNQLEQFFVENNIKSVKLEKNKLIIEFNEKNNANNHQLTVEQQQQISDFLITNNKQQLSLQDIRADIERERERETNPTSYIPWILGRIGIVAVLAIIIGLILNKKSKK